MEQNPLTQGDIEHPVGERQPQQARAYADDTVLARGVSRGEEHGVGVIHAQELVAPSSP